MQENIYNFIEDSEDDYWWFKARKNILIDFILKNRNNDSKKLLDVGCGSGYFLSHVSEYINNALGVEGYDYKNPKYKNIKKADVRDTGFESSIFDIITCLYVLEHIEIEQELLVEINRLLKNDGLFVITVPAYQWMFSEHDILNNHYRRYNKKMLRNVLNNNGFDIKKISYFNTILFPLAMFLRISEKITRKSNIDSKPSKLLNKLFYKIFMVEKYLLRYFNLPFGLSLIAVCQKRVNK